jgi:hypothetical protein
MLMSIENVGPYHEAMTRPDPERFNARGSKVDAAHVKSAASRRFTCANGVAAGDARVTSHTVAVEACVTVNGWPAIVRVVERSVDPEFGDALNDTVPVPVPEAPPVTVSHAALLEAVHAQPAPEATVTLPDPPVVPSACEVADSVGAHGTAACVTVTVCPAIVSVATRLSGPELAVALNETVPGPAPDAPAVTVSHAALLLAVHAQPAAALTVTLAEDAVGANAAVVVDSANVHGSVAPACVTVTVWPAIVSVAGRGVEPGLAVAVTVTVPFPVPLAPVAIVSQGALLVAVHAHADVTANAAEPAPAPMGSDVGDTDGEQDVADLPACAMAKVWLPTERIVLRSAPWLAAAVNRAVPLPVTCPLVTASQLSRLVAVHAHAPDPVARIELAVTSAGSHWLAASAAIA